MAAEQGQAAVRGPELFLALVGPLGTDLDGVSAVLRECLSEVSYDTTVIRLISKAEELIERDEAESGKKLGQNVRDTFPLADVFIDGSDPAALKGATRRFIELLFGYPFHTPTREEYGMFHASRLYRAIPEEPRASALS